MLKCVRMTSYDLGCISKAIFRVDVVRYLHLMITSKEVVPQPEVWYWHVL